MTTIIQSNGSHWGGEQPDGIDSLLAVLAAEPLNRDFEAYGNFVQKVQPGDMQSHSLDGLTHFWGNFYTVSHVFDIFTDDQELIDRLTALIRTNQQRTDYLSQPLAFRYNPDTGMHDVQEDGKVIVSCATHEEAQKAAGYTTNTIIR